MAKLNYVKFKRLNEDATIPTKAHLSDSGFDLYASEDVIIEPSETVIVPTGIAVGLPAGMEAQVRPRSGVTSKTKLRVQLGTIDNDYRGEIGVIVDNIAAEKPAIAGDISSLITGDGIHIMGVRNMSTYLIRKGDRIAQLVVQYLPKVTALETTESLGESERGEKGFGSSGVREGE